MQSSALLLFVAVFQTLDRLRFRHHGQVLRLELVLLIDAGLPAGLLFASHFRILSVPGTQRVLQVSRGKGFANQHLDLDVSLLLVNDGVWTDHCAGELD